MSDTHLSDARRNQIRLELQPLEQLRELPHAELLPEDFYYEGPYLVFHRRVSPQTRLLLQLRLPSLSLSIAFPQSPLDQLVRVESPALPPAACRSAIFFHLSGPLRSAFAVPNQHQDRGSLQTVCRKVHCVLGSHLAQ